MHPGVNHLTQLVDQTGDIPRHFPKFAPPGEVCTGCTRRNLHQPARSDISGANSGTAPRQAETPPSREHSDRLQPPRQVIPGSDQTLGVLPPNRAAACSTWTCSNIHITSPTQSHRRLTPNEPTKMPNRHPKMSTRHPPPRRSRRHSPSNSRLRQDPPGILGRVRCGDRRSAAPRT